MPRDGSNVYTQPFPNVVDGTTIESAVYNGFTNDVALDLNTPRPLVAGGTGATSAAASLFNLGGEKATQLVTDYDTQVWVPGSFRSAAAATGAPNATAIFSGVCYIHEALANPPTNSNVVVEARDITSGEVYVRTKTAGTWSTWKTERASIYAAPLDALAYSGMQINGGMEVSQELGVSAVTGVTNTEKYVVDGWKINTVGPQVMTAQQNAAAPLSFVASLQAFPTTANAAPAAGTYSMLVQSIEGYRFSRLGWGAANAQSITIGFWFYATRAGAFSGAVTNNLSNRSCTFSFTVNAVNTFEYKTVTIPGDTTGTWEKTNLIAAKIAFCQMVGSTYTTAAGVWNAGLFLGVPGSVNCCATTSDFILLTGVVVLPGIEAPTAARSPLIMRPYDQELVTCKRYWEKSYDYGTVAGAATGAGAVGIIMRAVSASATAGNGVGFRFAAEKRAAPSLVFYSVAGTAGALSIAPLGSSFVNAASSVAGIGTNGVQGVYTTGTSGMTTGQAIETAFHYTADARL